MDTLNEYTYKITLIHKRTILSNILFYINNSVIDQIQLQTIIF